MDKFSSIFKNYEYAVNQIIPITFTTTGYFYATGTAKSFSELTGVRRDVFKFLKSDATKEYIDALIKSLNSRNAKMSNFTLSKDLITYDNLVIVKQGGIPEQQGTWLHPKLAILFARWLSSKFAIWCDQQIDEILFSQKLKQLIDNDELHQFVGEKNIYYFIYIFYSDVLNAYKIGVSRNVERRFKQIQDNLKFLGFNPIGTEIIFNQICDSKKAFILEKQIHQYYEKYRLNESEWFSFSELQVNQVIDYIEKLITQKTDV